MIYNIEICFSFNFIFISNTFYKFYFTRSNIKWNDKKKFIIVALPTNDYLVQLNIEVTKDLEDEGIARDIIRAIQQNRKDADLNVSDHIKLKIFSTNQQILEAAKIFKNYIADQILADSFECAASAEEVKKFTNCQKFLFENKIDDGEFTAAFSQLTTQ